MVVIFHKMFHTSTIYLFLIQETVSKPVCPYGLQFAGMYNYPNLYKTYEFQQKLVFLVVY